MRFILPLFPYACEMCTPVIITVSVKSIIYAAIAALCLIDSKQIIAYSSVIHKN